MTLPYLAEETLEHASKLFLGARSNVQMLMAMQSAHLQTQSNHLC